MPQLAPRALRRTNVIVVFCLVVDFVSPPPTLQVNGRGDFLWEDADWCFTMVR